MPTPNSAKDDRSRFRSRKFSCERSKFISLTKQSAISTPRLLRKSGGLYSTPARTESYLIPRTICMGQGESAMQPLQSNQENSPCLEKSMKSKQKNMKSGYERSETGSSLGDVRGCRTPYFELPVPGSPNSPLGTTLKPEVAPV